MGLATTQLGGKHQGLPGRQYHWLSAGGEAREALQEVEKVVLQTQSVRLHRLGELALPDSKGRTNHGAGKGSGMEPCWCHRVPQTTHVYTLVYGFQEGIEGDGIRAGECDIGGKDTRTHTETFAGGSVAYAIARHHRTNTSCQVLGMICIS